MKKIYVDEKFNGIRFNKFLQKTIDVPSSFIYKMLRKKNILLNEKKADGSEKLNTGDSISIYMSDETYDKLSVKGEKNLYKYENIKQSDIETLKQHIIYEDDNLIIIDKWRGIKSQDDKKNNISIDSLAKKYLLLKNETGSGIVNRLDTNTIGLIVFAKNYISKRDLSSGFINNNIEKTYMALVSGKLERKNGDIVLFAKKDEKKNKTMIEESESFEKEGYKRIESQYEVVDYIDKNTLVQVKILTGKSHQIRASFSYIGHPVIGDKKYGNTSGELKLMSYKIRISDLKGELEYLNDKEFTSKYDIKEFYES